MVKKNNISKLKNCYGCGVCATGCPRNIIDIIESKDGFYEPKITEIESCTHCGICLDVCSYNNISITYGRPISSYAAWSLDEEVRFNSSSGGVAYELSREALNNGYLICSVVYDKENNIAIHKIIKNVNELNATQGSKYIPSFTSSGFNSFNLNPSGSEKYLVFGTPCQIASLRQLLKRYRCESNYLLVDFFCHGMPSLKVWHKYIHERRELNDERVNIKWRDKKRGWHDSYYIVGELGDKKEIFRSKNVRHDEFYNFFLGHYGLNECCISSCKFKVSNSMADIRLGDLWGNKYNDNEDGVSCVICLSKRGEDILKQCQRLEKIPEDLDVVTVGQMKNNAGRPYGYTLAKTLISTNLSLSQIITLANLYGNIRSFPKRIASKVLHSIHK